MFFIPALKTVYMGGETGRLAGRDVFYPGFKNCLYGRPDGIFAGTGRFSSRVYMRMFLPGTISPRTICKVSIISSRQSGTECLYNKNCPSLAGIRSSKPRSRFAGTGRKTSQQTFFPYKRNGTNKRYIHTWRDPVQRPVPANVPPRLPYKQALSLTDYTYFLYWF